MIRIKQPNHGDYVALAWTLRSSPKFERADVIRQWMFMYCAPPRPTDESEASACLQAMNSIAESIMSSFNESDPKWQSKAGVPPHFVLT